MRLHPRCVVVLMFLLVPATARASDHVASIFGAYSPLFGSTHHGLQFGLEVSWPTTHKIHDYLVILVDAAVYGGTDDAGNQFTKAALLGGLRLLRRNKDGKGPLVGFVHALGGRHRSHIGTTVDNGWAAAAGGGLDILFAETATSGWAFRNQLDWVRVAGQNSTRFSTGFAFRFKEAPVSP